MAAINDLINQISDAELRDRIQSEVNKLSKQKKFGLVFEEHLPECAPLYDMPIKVGCKVMLRDRSVDKSIYVVGKIDNDEALCVKQDGSDPIAFALADIVRIAEFGEAIYPYLKPLDSVCNAPDSDLWHTLIEADNYHALQLLEYLYAGKVDCIYIDPPYNTGTKDWKYNNDYVDSNDAYRHSKWLSMMEKRLILAKKLLNPRDSVLIITIDEKEYLHLGCLLEEIFPEANIQMVSSVIAHHGTSRANEFSRVNEFLYFVMFGDYKIEPLSESGYVKKGEPIHWQSYRRSNPSNLRPTRPSQFYAIYIDNLTHKIVKVGNAITPDVDRHSVPQLDGCTAVFPVRDDGTEMMWSLVPEECRARVRKGYIRPGKYNPDKPQPYAIQYLMSGTIKDIDDGKILVKGIDDDGSIIAENVETKLSLPKTQWDDLRYDARDYGTKVLKTILCDARFNFPKSIYAVYDCIKLFTKNKKSALVVDFFAGSGTTLHAVNLLNAEDGGHRRCIMVTNNEVSDDEAKSLTKQGYHPGDDKWNELGIARYVTWPRTVCSIEGHDANGNPLKGNYLGEYNGKELPMADGFKANAAFFQLGFLDKTAVELGMQFKEMLPTLWMKAGAVGPCPQIDNADIDMLVLPQNRFAVLLNEGVFPSFKKQLLANPEIQTVYLVTDFDINYRSMANDLPVEKTYQLYRDYLDNFRINHGRN